MHQQDFRHKCSAKNGTFLLIFSHSGVRPILIGIAAIQWEEVNLVFWEWSRCRCWSRAAGGRTSGCWRAESVERPESPPSEVWNTKLITTWKTYFCAKTRFSRKNRIVWSTTPARCPARWSWRTWRRCRRCRVWRRSFGACARANARTVPVL